MALCITMRGTRADGKQAHILLYINDSLTDESYVTAWKKQYTFDIPYYIEEINSVKIVFDNDTYTRYKDRNLFVYKLEINHIIYPVRSDNTSTGHFYRGNAKKIHKSYNEFVANYIKELGYSDSIYYLNTKKKRIGRTYSDAQTFTAWYLKSAFKDTPVTILTSKDHSKRSWLIYRHILPDNIPLGCLYFEWQSTNTENCSEYNVLHEYASLVYTHLVIIPCITIKQWFNR
jgi:hypothetical protein